MKRKSRVFKSDLPARLSGVVVSAVDAIPMCLRIAVPSHPGGSSNIPSCFVLHKPG